MTKLISKTCQYCGTEQPKLIPITAATFCVKCKRPVKYNYVKVKKTDLFEAQK